MPYDPVRARDLRLRRQYGITTEQYEQMLAHQGGVCAVCRRPPKNLPLNVDHDHTSGLVRGLLCWRCNSRVIGAARDDPSVLRAAAEYLDHPPACAAIGAVYGRTGRVTKKRRRRRKTPTK